MDITVKFWIFIIHLLGSVSGYRTLLCPAGSYEYTKMTGVYPDYIFTSRCVLCEEGKYTATAGQTACTPCCNPNGYMWDCHQYSTLGATSCQQRSTQIRADCTKDQSMTTYEHEFETGCKCYGTTQAHSGVVVYIGGTCSNCVMHYTCTECIQGRYWAPACTACPAGAYSDTAQATVCTLCATGKYKAATDAAACTDCGAGKYSATSAATAEAACTACANGSSSPTQSSAIGACTAIAGYFGAPGSSSFTKCPDNSNSPAGASAVGACFANAGYTGPISGAFTACAAGKYKATTGTAACTDCVAGKWSAASTATAEATCTACAGGSSSPQGSTAINACVANAGYTGPISGAFTACAAGKYKAQTGPVACSDCTAGKWSASSAATAETACLSCPQNSQAVAGSTAINACVANNGFFGNPGGPFTVCGLGTYSSATGATACVSCGNFAVTLSTGSTSAAACVCQIGYTNGTTSSRRLLTYESTHVPQGPPTPPLLKPTISRHRQTPQSPQSLRIEYGFSRPRRLFGRRSLDIGTCSPCQPYYKNASGNEVCTSCPTSMYSPDGLSCVFKFFNTTSSLKTTSPSIQSSVSSTTTAFQNTTTTIVTTTPAPVVVPTSTSIYIITARTTPAPVSETQTNNVFLVIGIVCGCFMLLCLCLICCLCFSFESNDRKEEYQRKLLD